MTVRRRLDAAADDVAWAKRTARPPAGQQGSQPLRHRYQRQPRRRPAWSARLPVEPQSPHHAAQQTTEHADRRLRINYQDRPCSETPVRSRDRTGWRVPVGTPALVYYLARHGSTDQSSGVLTDSLSRRPDLAQE